MNKGAMRSGIWTLVVVGLLAPPALALPGEPRAATDDDWCRDDDWGSRRARHCEVRVPRDTALRLEADNGGISLKDVTGTAEFSTVNGGVHLERVGGHVRGQTVNGGVHLELAGTEWEGEGLDVRTTNGGVHLTIPSDYNARLETGTVNGGVHSDLPVTSSRRRHSGGRIETDLGRGGRLLHVETTNGGLHVKQR